ncbi:replicative DNA helicase [Dysosmobacter sp.]|jgi:replicative DNA helicase|uniref:replicative DNA helicase n=1 Tax=Dysosmobacter sp. TaxID=2591382 RepID=UPI003D91382E
MGRRWISTSNQYHDLSAEQAVLGSMLIDSSCIRTVAGRLREADFCQILNQKIYAAMVAMDMDGRAVDGLTVADTLHASDETRRYLAELMETTPTSANVMEYAAIVQECARRRGLKSALGIALEALDNGADQADVLPGLETTISDINTRSGSDLMDPKEQMDRFFRHRERIEGGEAPYVRTGLRQLDKLLGGGLIKQGLYFLAARPGMGKTALAIAIAEYVASTIGPVAFVSMEMSDEQVNARRVAALAKIDSSVILTETMTEAEYRKVSEAARTIGRTPLYVTAGKAYSPGHMAAMCRSRKDCRLVVVDHFSLFLLPGRQASHIEYAAAAHTLKRLAQTMDAPVLCLAQLNRENEQRNNKRPRLSDLRATGAAEEDADGVILLHREDYYDPKFERKSHEPVVVEAALAKNRHGRTGQVDLSFWPETNTFREKFVK